MELHIYIYPEEASGGETPPRDKVGYVDAAALPQGELP